MSLCYLCILYRETKAPSDLQAQIVIFMKSVLFPEINLLAFVSLRGYVTDREKNCLYFNSFHRNICSKPDLGEKKKATMKDGDAEWTEWMSIQIFYLVISRSVVWIVYICFVK